VIYRRSALEEVGGIAQVDHSEDVFTTLKFLEVGKRVFYLNEQLAVGLAPATLIGYYNQQFRWARGGFEMMFKHGTLFNRRLRLDQRVQFFFSNFFYLSGITVAIYLLSPLVAVVFNVKPISDAYLWQWLPKYALFFACNLGFFISFAPRNRIATMVLGTFSYLPYTAAMVLVLTGFPHVAWKPTNARATGLITILLAPYIVFVVVAGAVAGMLVTRTMRFNATLGEYYFWLAADLVVAVFFIIHAYIARSRVILPSFDDPQPRIDPRPVMTAAEAA
jgi:cellulose synthase (UDP-forming)